MTHGNSTSDSSSSWVDRFVRGMPTASVVIYSVIFLVGTLGNGLVIYVTGCRMKKSVNSVWFFNLALADFIFTSFLIFLIVTLSQEYQWYFGDFMCKLSASVNVISMFTSIFLLTAISLDRCLSVCVVVWAQNKRTVAKAQIAVAVIWVVAAVCSSPYACFRKLQLIRGKSYCLYAVGTPKLTLTTFRFVVGFLIPFLFICVSNIAIGVRARRLQRTKRHRPHRIILAIIFAFFFCWLPFHVVQFLEFKVGTPKYITHVGGPLCLILASTNSCLNPFLYVFMCDEFRRKLKRSICYVLESALAEEHLSFMSSRSLSSHLSVLSRKSDSAAPVQDRKKSATSFKLIENQRPSVEETRDTE